MKSKRDVKLLKYISLLGLFVDNVNNDVVVFNHEFYFDILQKNKKKNYIITDSSNLQNRRILFRSTNIFS